MSWPRAIFLVASLATAASCARHIEVPATAFSTLAPYTRGEATIVRDGRQPPFVLAPDMEPKALARGDGPCVGAEFGASSACTYQASAPLELVRLTPAGGVVVAPAEPPGSCLFASQVDPAIIDHAAVEFEGLSIPLAKQDLPRVLEYSRSRHLALSDSGRAVHVGPLQRPTLRLHLSAGCSFVHECHADTIVVALESVVWGEGTLRLCRGRDVVLEPNTKGRLELRVKHAPAYRPRFGLGLDAAGPSLLLSITGHWFPTDWMVVEGGITPLASAGNGAWLGGRWRLSLGRSLVVSTGAAAAVLIAFGASSNGHRASTSYLMGPRLAAEIVLPSGRDVLKIEAQLAHSNLFAWRWHPWGGIAYVHWY